MKKNEKNTSFFCFVDVLIALVTWCSSFLNLEFPWIPTAFHGGCPIALVGYNSNGTWFSIILGLVKCWIDDRFNIPSTQVDGISSYRCLPCGFISSRMFNSKFDLRKQVLCPFSASVVPVWRLGWESFWHGLTVESHGLIRDPQGYLQNLPKMRLATTEQPPLQSSKVIHRSATWTRNPVKMLRPWSKGRKMSTAVNFSAGGCKRTSTCQSDHVPWLVLTLEMWQPKFESGQNDQVFHDIKVHWKS